MLAAAVAELDGVDAAQQMLTAPQQNGGNDPRQPVDQPGAQVLAHGGGAAADAYVLAVGRCGARSVERLVNTARDEVEHRAAFHLDGWAGVVASA